MKVKELMVHNAVSVNEKDFITHVRQVMRDHKYSMLPVVDDNNHVKGIITDKDAMRVTSTRSNITVEGFISELSPTSMEDEIQPALSYMGKMHLRHLPVVKSPEEPVLVGIISLSQVFKTLEDKMPEKKISEIMNTNVKTCQRSDTLNKVWAALLDSDYSGMPVVDGKEPVGIITIQDIIKSGYARIEKESRHERHTRVEKIMNTPVYTINKNETIKKAVEKLLKLNVGRLMVTDRTQLVGIVDVHDISNELIQHTS